MRLSKPKFLIRIVLFILLLFIISCVTPPLINNAYCSTDEAVSERIKGVADFLIERANETVISMFEDRINSNHYISQYFPETTMMMKTFDLKILMLNGTLWRYSVEQDLNSLAEVLKKELQREGVSMLSDDAIVNAKAYQMKIMGENAEPLLAVKLDKFVKEAENNLSMIKYDVLIDTDSVYIAEMYLNDSIDHFSDLFASNPKISREVIGSSVIIQNLVNMRNSYEHVRYAFDKSQPFSVRAGHIFLIIENLKEPEKLIDINSDAYKKFKIYSLFFASLSDANTAADAKAVLKTFALPVNSYRAKRKKEMRFSISSYLGYAAIQERSGIDIYTYGGLVAPIGFEYSMVPCKNWGSLSVLGSVFDLGSVVNSQIHGNNETFGFKDIVAPGLSLIYGFKKLPFAVGIGGFAVRGLQQNMHDEQRYMLFFAIDMPLFPLF